jgi:hypothetical protein
MKITWKRVSAKGFIPSHWEGQGPHAEMSIWQRAIIHSRCRREYRAYLMPGNKEFPNVAAAKAAAEEMVEA